MAEVCFSRIYGCKCFFYGCELFNMVASYDSVKSADFDGVFVPLAKQVKIRRLERKLSPK